MHLSCSIRAIACLSTILCALVGCQRQSKESPETQQARAMADRKEALKFLNEDGEVDWRMRVDAAAKELDQAKSDRRWGRSESALEHALEAAQLLPPTSKQFDPPPSPAPSADAGDKDDGDAEPSGGDQPELADEQNDAGSEGSSESQSVENEGEESVTDAEVQQLRESLDSLLESLDGKVGTAKSGSGRSGLSFERDAIEIR